MNANTPRPAGKWAGKGSRHERGYGSEWDRARKIIIQRDKGLCQPCLRLGRVTPFQSVDHITPKAKGGTDDHDNLQAICKACHDAKTLAEAGLANGWKPKRKIGADGWPEP